MKPFFIGALAGTAYVVALMLVVPWLFRFLDWYFSFVRSWP